MCGRDSVPGICNVIFSVCELLTKGNRNRRPNHQIPVMRVAAALKVQNHQNYVYGNLIIWLQ